MNWGRNIGVALLLFAGLVVWFASFVRFRKGQAACQKYQFEPAPRGFAELAIGLLIWMAVPMIAQTEFGWTDEPSLANVQTQCISSGLVLILLFPILILPLRLTPRELGLRFDGLARQLADGTIGFFASFPPVILTLFLTEPIRPSERQHSFLKFLQDNPTPDTVAWLVIAVVFLGPLAEELVHRVVIQSVLTVRLRPALAIILTAVYFCMGHSPTDALPLFPLAIILGYVYYRRHSYLAVVLLHALFNATMLILTMMSIND